MMYFIPTWKLTLSLPDAQFIRAAASSLLLIYNEERNQQWLNDNTSFE